MKNKKVKWLMAMAWMVLIFAFSSQPGDTSEETSQFVIYIFNLLGLDLHSYFGALADFAVRKGAHFTEYFILYLLLYNAIRESFSFRKALLFSMVGVFLYASSDEFHQSFVPGRGPAFRDVLIDSSGGLLCLVVITIKNLVSKRKS